MKLLAILLLLYGCSFFFPGKEGSKTAKGAFYKVTFKYPDWENKKDNRSDYIFQNKDGRILLSNSFCNEFQDQPLNKLAGKTFRTIDNFKAKPGKYITFHDREAYRLDGSGLVDGVKVKLRLLNTRRNNCYFDFIGITPKGTTDEEAIFESFLKSVVFK